MINAAAPMTGGIIWPAEDADASTPPAKDGLYPHDFISGIVNDPVVTTLARELPDIVPRSPLATTAVFAGPPAKRPVRAKARSMNSFAPPVTSRKHPKTMKAKTKVVITAIGVPNMPSAVKNICAAIRCRSYPLCPIKVGM